MTLPADMSRADALRRAAEAIAEAENLLGRHDMKKLSDRLADVRVDVRSAYEVTLHKDLSVKKAAK
jgi:hypothetical protein